MCLTHAATDFGSNIMSEVGRHSSYEILKEQVGTCWSYYRESMCMHVKHVHAGVHIGYVLKPLAFLHQDWFRKLVFQQPKSNHMGWQPKGNHMGWQQRQPQLITFEPMWRCLRCSSKRWRMVWEFIMLFLPLSPINREAFKLQNTPQGGELSNTSLELPSLLSLKFS